MGGELLVSMGCEEEAGLFLWPANAGPGVRKPVPGRARTCRGGGRGSGLDAIVLRRRRCLLAGLLRVLLVGFVATDNASCYNADLAVSCHMARDAGNDGALDASLRFGR